MRFKMLLAPMILALATPADAIVVTRASNLDLTTLTAFPRAPFTDTLFGDGAGFLPVDFPLNNGDSLVWTVSFGPNQKLYKVRPAFRRELFVAFRSLDDVNGPGNVQDAKIEFLDENGQIIAEGAKQTWYGTPGHLVANALVGIPTPFIWPAEFSGFRVKLDLLSGTVVSNWSFSNISFDGVSLTPAVTSGVPEPSVWALLIAGFGAVGASLRRNRFAKAKILNP